MERPGVGGRGMERPGVGAAWRGWWHVETCQGNLTIVRVPLMARPLVLVLPARDEERTVGDVVARTPPEVGGHAVHVVVVDDGSRDATATKARGAGAHVVSQPPRGLGAAVRTGFTTALGCRPGCNRLLRRRRRVRTRRTRTDGRAGSRRHRRLRRRLAVRRHHRSHASSAPDRQPRAHRCGRRARAARITDGQSGYRALSPAAARAAEIIHDYNYAQVLTLDLLRKGFRYAEVPISYSFRREGTSFVRLFPYLRNVVPAVYRELRTAPQASRAGTANELSSSIPLANAGGPDRRG